MEGEEILISENCLDKLFFHCPFECGKVYLIEKNMKNHIHRVHFNNKINVDSPNCDVCRVDFKNTREMKLHAEILHTPQKLIKCDCGKEFQTTSRLNIHKRTHTGVKPYECPVCKKSFSEKGNLKVHERIHTGDKPYKCEFPGCSQSFRSQGNYINHVNSHLGLRPHQCEICQKTFTRKYVLKKHQLCHIERVFKCEMCPKSYKNPSSLENHFKLKHNFGISNSVSNLELVTLTPPPNLEKSENFTNSESLKSISCYTTCNINFNLSSQLTYLNNEETITEK